MKTVRIASGQGFWGDSIEAPVHQIRDGKIDYLILDYLAELTMSILSYQKRKDPNKGFAHDFVSLMSRVLEDVIDKDIRVIANAGGVNAKACGEAVAALAKEKQLKRQPVIAIVEGDNIVDSIDELISKGNSFTNLDTGKSITEISGTVQSANAYLGSAPIIEALKSGADIIITGRVADASMAVAPLAHEFNWNLDDWDRLALATIAGHVIECGAQASGGNCSYDWESIPELENVGYPIIEASDNGSMIITKHEKSGGRVDLRSVKEQLVYEIGDPKSYITPDVVADFSSVSLKEVGENRVQISDAKGSAITDTYKVSISYSGGYKAEGTLVYTWPDAYKKSLAAGKILRKRLEALALPFDEILTESVGVDACHGSLSNVDVKEIAEVTFRIAVRSKYKDAVERFTRELAPLVLNGPPTATAYASGRPRVLPVFAYWPALIPRTAVTASVSFLRD